MFKSTVTSWRNAMVLFAGVFAMMALVNAGPTRADDDAEFIIFGCGSPPPNVFPIPDPISEYQVLFGGNGISLCEDFLNQKAQDGYEISRVKSGATWPVDQGAEGRLNLPVLVYHMRRVIDD